MKNYTTIEQSKKLLELGLDHETADMCWEQHYNREPIITVKPYTTKGKSIGAHCCDAWSLGALLEVMPFFITIKEEGEPDEYYHFQLNRNGSVFRSKWRASYHGLKTERGKVHTRRIHWAVGPKGESDTPIEAAYSMVVWLLENEYIK